MIVCFARLRLKDIDFSSKLIIVRTGKGEKDSSTMLPEAVKTDLYLHLERVRALHEEDLRAEYGEVYLPYHPISMICSIHLTNLMESPLY